MKTYKQFINESYSYSSVQVKMPTGIGARMVNFGSEIPDDELAVDGRDERPHITIKYGLTSPSVDALDSIKEQFPEKITATMGKTSLFTSDNNDVLKVDIDSPDLVALNKLIVDNTDNVNTHPEYHAHSTIAYIKSGNGSKYAGDDRFDGEKVSFSVIEFSSKDNDKYIKIPLRR